MQISWFFQFQGRLLYSIYYIMPSRPDAGVGCLFWVVMITLPQHPISSRPPFGPRNTTALLERVEHHCPLLFSSLGGWVLGWNESWKFRLLPACTCCLLASSVCAFLVDYFLPHCQLLHVTKWGGGRRKKKLWRVRFSFTSSLSSFLPCSELPLSSSRKGAGGWWEKRWKRTGPKVIYNHRQLDHFLATSTFSKSHHSYQKSCL